MRVIAVKTLKEYWEGEPAAEASLKAWFAEARAATWENPAAVKKKYGSASILKSGRVVFNISGNKYRLVIRVNYKVGIVYIRFVGTHAE